MTDYFSYTLDADAIRAISSIGLAHLGDAVYELLVRTYLCAVSYTHLDVYKRQAVGFAGEHDAEVHLADDAADAVFFAADAAAVDAVLHDRFRLIYAVKHGGRCV